MDLFFFSLSGLYLLYKDIVFKFLFQVEMARLTRSLYK